MENLARAGAFDCFETPTAPDLVEQADKLIAHCQSVAAERAGGQVSLFGGDQAPRAARA
jgi:DNA polymerase-3 subunit alpha